MIDLKNAWVRFRTLPDEVLENLPEYVQNAFRAARDHGFGIEMVCANARIPANRRAAQRFVLVADDVDGESMNGPVNFDLTGLAADAQGARRMFIISSGNQSNLYAAAYAAAVEDLLAGYPVSLIVETRAAEVQAWVRTLTALRDTASPVAQFGSDRSEHIAFEEMPAGQRSA